MEVENKLRQLGFEVPASPEPVAHYIASVQVGNTLFVGVIPEASTGNESIREKSALPLP